MSTKKQIQAQLARALADYDNLRKRGEAEKDTWVKFSSERILTKLLPILDSLREAQNHLQDSGLAITIRELEKVLIEEGIEEITPQKGEAFDESCQEAIEVVKGNKKDNNKISEVVLSGWKYAGGQVIRYAKVICQK
mgnify:CR=1 FL=1